MTNRSKPHYTEGIVRGQLERMGLDIRSESKGWAMVLCPLHDDQKTPSLSIQLASGGWKCLAGCGQNADLADLVSRVTGEPFDKIKQELSAERGTAAHLLDMLAEVEPGETEVEPLFYEIGKVPKYWINRGFTLKQARQWSVGYDAEEHSLVIPIKLHGKIKGLIYRRLRPNDNRSKYKYSPGFDKSNYVFGEDEARLLLEQGGSLWIVEGPLDAIWVQGYGYPCVAALGVPLTATQGDIIKKMAVSVVLAFDNDDAGRKATNQAKDLLRMVPELRILPLPEGKKDVQECTEEELMQAYSSALPSYLT